LSEAATTPELLERRARERAGEVAYTFLSDGEAVGEELSYGELHRRVLALAAGLEGEGLRGERAVLLFPPGLDFVVAFYACLHAGVVAVPAYPAQRRRGLDRLRAIVGDSEARLALTDEAGAERARRWWSDDDAFAGLRWASGEELARAGRGAEPAARVEAGDLAFLQYTSGSTSTPKGVRVSHANLLANQRAIRETFGESEASVIVGWLPLYHDMGLIGNVLQPLYLGGRCILMSPVAFLQRPLRWLRAISEYGGTTSGGPNFAYELCVRKIAPEERAELDLSPWSLAFNGAEPIRAETLESFARTFGECGFEPSSFAPCYGLAEGTLMVSGRGRGDGGPVVREVDAQALERDRVEPPSQDEGRALVGSGQAAGEHRILVVDPERRTPCPPGRVGEIWVAGPSVAGGYWRREEETRRDFEARLAGSGEGPFLRTGDLGFLDEGELFVTGRLKDLVIIRGLNHYPQDIELTAERSHPALRAGGGAAFSVEVAGEERLVVVQEVERHTSAEELAEALERLAEAVAEAHDLALHAAVLIRTQTLPKTSSGKVRRAACRELFLAGELQVVTESSGAEAAVAVPSPAELPPAPADGELEPWLRAQLAARLGLAAEDLDPAVSIGRYGVDSLMAIELAHAVELALGVVLPLEVLLDRPSLGELAETIAELSAAVPAAPIVTGGAGGSWQPLSAGQEALFFLQERSPESGVYNVAGAARLHGALETGAFERALGRLAERHPQLGARFELREGGPAVQPGGGPEPRLERHDARAWSPERLRGELAAAAERPIDLGRGPLLRVELFERSDDERVLLLAVHHAVVDFWSLARVLGELDALYAAELTGREAELEAPGASYADFVRWQAETLAGERGEGLRGYWRECLAGPLPALDLPTDRPRPAERRHRGAAELARLGTAARTALERLARERETTLFAVLLAGWQALLHRLTGQDELIVGSPTAGRVRADFAPVVGYFVNLVPLRADLSGGPSFARHLGRTEREVRGALAHQEYPLSEMLGAVGAERDPSRTPLFDAVFVLQRAPGGGGEGLVPLALGLEGERARLGTLELEAVALERRSAQFDLTLTFGELAEGLGAELRYNRDLFEPTTARRMLGHLGRLLEAAAAAPERSVIELPLLSASERAQLLEWASARPVEPRAQTLHGAVLGRAAEAPAAIALGRGGERLSYGELVRRSGALARHLRRLGVGTETPVALWAERSLAVPVAMLGILEAGAAWVPLDPSNPPERLERIAADTGAEILVSAAGAPELSARFVHTVELDALFADLADLADAPAPAEVPSEATAYVIYTSGSTGVPKGVPVSHRSALRLFAATEPVFDFGPGEVFSVFHSFAFDFSVWELWGALVHGARAVVASEAERRSPAAFAELLERERVSHLSQTPSAFRELMRAEPERSGALAALDTVVFGGEALGPPSLRPWLDRHGGRRPRLINMYGITETTVHVTWRPIAEADAAESSSPIGVAIPDQALHVLDRRLEPVPIGVAGELHVGGAGLSRGYRGRPALAAERFVPDPFSGRSGARLYKSGDLGCFRPNGELEHLGRADRQVKIRGFRIELGEIEAALARHPALAAVVVRPRAEGAARTPLAASTVAEERPVGELRTFLKDPRSEAQVLGSGRAEPDPEERLVAYFVCPAVSAPTVSELRRFAAEALPEYMVPAAFVRLDALPLTVNGKLDLDALPAPDAARPDLDVPWAAPRDALEETLAEVWGEVLGIDRVGLDDDYFELGGDSIRSIRVIARAEERGLAFSLDQLFEAPTVRRLAEALRGAEGAVEMRSWTPSEPFCHVGAEDRARLGPGIEDAYPLARIQAGVIYHSQANLAAPMYHDIFFYHLGGRFDLGLWRRTFAAVVARHPILRTSFDLASFAEPLQRVHRQVEPEIGVFDLRRLAPADCERAQERWIAAEKRRPFDWSVPPMIRFHLHRLEAGVFHLVLSFHDAILDGWSTARLIVELLEGYAARLAGREPAPAPPPSVAFRDFVAAEREALASEEHREFWRRTLDGAPNTPLPRWRAPRPAEEPEIAVLDVPISAAVSSGLKRLARRAGVPLKHVLLAAHVRALAVWSGRREVVTGLESNGRLEVAEGERTLGIHLNSLPLRVRLGGGTWVDLVREVFRTERELLPFRRLPLAELQKGRQGAMLFETIFNYTHFHAFQALRELEGLEVLGARGFGETHFVLRVEFNRDPFSDRVQLDLECDVNEISPAQLEALGAVYAQTLEAMASAEPGSAHDAHPALAPAARHQAAIEWNDTEIPPPPVASVLAWFDRQVERRAGAAAVVCGGRELDYRELDREANRLAHHLQGLGVGPDARVAVLLERSVEGAVAILAVLKAGGAYLPIDPQWPAERIAFLLRDARPAVLLTRGHAAAGVAAELPVLSIEELAADGGEPPWADAPATPPAVAGDGEHLAYVIYTSGSTGTPKGVGVSRRNLLASTWSRRSYYRREVRAYLLIAPFAFDSSVAGIYWAWSQGGTLVIPEEGDQKEPARLIELVARHRISHLLAIPSLYRLLLEQAPPGSLDSLEVAIAAGEAFPAGLVGAHAEHRGSTELYNEYGPTEGTVWSTVQRCDTLAPGGTAVPIGRPIPGWRVHLLDAGLQPVPPGAIGELHLAGPGLARGYLDRPGLTAARFVPDPFAREGGGRLYRTGDVARADTQGRLEFQGRIDEQVKVRGYRIELGEIEARLSAHDTVRQAVVVAREDPPGHRRLVAYAVLQEGASATPEELAEHLASSLPDYMVPAFVVLLDELPTNANGKVDRRRLPAPSLGRPDPGDLEAFLKFLEELPAEEAQAMLAEGRIDFGAAEALSSGDAEGG